MLRPATLGLWVNAGTPVHLDKARLTSCPVIIKRAAYSCGLVKRAAFSCGLAALVLLCGGRALQNAIAEGDTRTISLHHMHTDEDITITFKRDGRYDEAALNKLNWFLRDWRKQQETKMDPHLIDLIWEVQRETGSKERVWVVCGYRSPETNAMLRRRSSGVARFSQHMLGHAMDFYIPGVQLDQLRAVGLRLQRGGVGFYPSSGSPFVHMDTGGIRMWPRMTHEQLVRVFPNQRTVYLPSDGRPLAGYELALADIRKRGDGADVAVADAGGARHFNPFSKLIQMARGNSDEEDADGAPSAPAPAPAASEPLRTRAKAAVASAIDRVEEKLAAEKTKLAQAASNAETKLAAEKAKVEEKLAAEKTKLAQVAANAETKLAAEKTKLAKIASNAHVISRAEAAPMADTPNQIILARGPIGRWRNRRSGASKPHRNCQCRPHRIDPATRKRARRSRFARNGARLRGASQERGASRHACGSAIDRAGSTARRAHPRRRSPGGRQRHDRRGQARARPHRIGRLHRLHQEGVARACRYHTAERSVAARHRGIAKREPLPLHLDARRARLPLSR
jgi:uncharacterized protein YcbK (DUF882 family)